MFNFAQCVWTAPIVIMAMNVKHVGPVGVIIVQRVSRARAMSATRIRLITATLDKAPLYANSFGIDTTKYKTTHAQKLSVQDV